MKKKAFTLIEILLVVFLLSMIVVSMRNVFLMKNKDLIKSQTCVNYVYWEIKNAFDFVSFWRGFATWDSSNSQIIYPNKMIIDFDSLNDRINLTYSWIIQSWEVLTGISWTIMPPFLLSGTDNGKYDCYSDKYFVNISWANLNLKVNYQLQWDINNPALLINNSSNIYTWESFFYYCPIPSMDCKIIGKIVIDKRSSFLKFNRCLRTENGKDCDAWWQ